MEDYGVSIGPQVPLCSLNSVLPNAIPTLDLGSSYTDVLALTDHNINALGGDNALRIFKTHNTLDLWLLLSRLTVRRLLTDM